MPSVSTSWIVKKPLDKGIEYVYTHNSETKTNSNEHLHDAKLDYCCFPPTLTDEDVNPNTVQVIKNALKAELKIADEKNPLFSNFTRAIDNLINQRRQLMEKQKNSPGCTIL